VAIGQATTSQARRYGSPRDGVRTIARLALLCLPLAGCAPAVPWQFGRYEDVQRRSADANQLFFVYFRNWYLKECTDFEENVLKQPEVLRELRSMICTPLDFDWDRARADRWGVSAVPACVIVAPDGAVLAVEQTPIIAEQLLSTLRSVKADFAAGAETKAEP
jgi:hypothetical protein